MTPFSILDLSPVPAGGSAAQSLRNSIDLARHADGLGYRRFWLAEHHNLANIASSAPDIMIGQVAAATRNMRVGSGGVMLPNHAPLTVAERFKVLEALFPGRIDLGIGRAPGTDHVTSVALRRRQDIRDEDDFLDRFQELLLLENDGYPKDHPFRNVRAMPNDVALPPILLLGSSDYSAQLAAQIGAGFSFAHHFAGHRCRATPMRALSRQVPAFAATEGTAARSSRPRPWSRNRRPRPSASPPPSTSISCAAPRASMRRWKVRKPRSPMIIRRSTANASRKNRERLAVGTPGHGEGEARRTRSPQTKADEIMITTMIYDHEARKRSYTLLAEAFSVAPSAC